MDRIGVTDATILVAALRDPATTASLDARGWTALLTIARAERLIGTLAYRLQKQNLPPAVAAILADERTNAEYQKRSALWEADCARRALADYPAKVVLMKGTAYAAAGLRAAEGRHIGDLDIMVARDDLPQVEAALLTSGWEWVKDDAYDDAYYRDHMHELPPLIHKERDRMIDVHHTILPLTARPKPDAAVLLREAVFLNSVCPELVEGQEGARGRASTSSARTDNLCIFSPVDMVVHSAAHLFADGEFDGGLRNLWDIHCLLTEFADEEEDFFLTLAEGAWHYGLSEPVNRALRLSQKLYGTKLVAYDGPIKVRYDSKWSDYLFVRRLTARDEWGTGTRKLTRLAFYIRSHWLRMPPFMLMQHLWVKWRKK